MDSQRGRSPEDDQPRSGTAAVAHGSRPAMHYGSCDDSPDASAAATRGALDARDRVNDFDILPHQTLTQLGFFACCITFDLSCVLEYPFLHGVQEN